MNADGVGRLATIPYNDPALMDRALRRRFDAN